MEQALPLRPSSRDLIRWLLIVGIIVAVSSPYLYENQKHIEPVVGECMVPREVTTSLNTQPTETWAMKLEDDPSMGEMLDRLSGVEAPTSLTEGHPGEGPKRNSLSVRGNKKEILLQPIILRAANRYQVDPALIKAIIMAESSYNPKAISRRGARGLMQLMPRTAEALGVGDSFNPEQNINAGVRHFKRLLDRFKGDVKLALAAYNAGSKKVRRYQGVPPFKATRFYIRKVLEYQQYYKEEMAS